MARLQRTQAVILNADVVNYSGMMALDAVSTVETLLSHLRRIAALVDFHAGQVLDATGDNLLARFRTESGALSCAHRILLAIDEDNRRKPEARRMRFRIGLHSGEVIEYGGRVYGDVVNLAARLQAAAPESGILMSERCAARADWQLGDHAGLQRFKNIPYGVPAVRMQLAG